MNAVFLKILNLSLTASLLILAVLPIRLLMKKAPKWLTCLLWGIVALALVCPVRLESPMSVLPAADPIVITSDTPQTTDTLPLVQEEPILIQDFIENQNATGEVGNPLSPLEIGTAVWCLGMAALLGYAVFSTLRLKRQVAASMETERNVFLCDDIDTPFILDILRPRIYLPSALDEATAAQVLLHERAHLARKDHWWKPMGYLLLTLHWFNPLVWLAYALLCTDIELACDEKVIKDMDSGSKKSYSEALLTCSMPRRMIAACPLAFGEVSVKQRIGAVLHYKKPAFWVIVIAILICIALCFGFLTNPVAMTLDSIGDVFAEEIEEIEFLRIPFNEDSLTQNRATLFGLLSQVELQPEVLIKTPLDKDFFIIVLTRYENAATYELCFSSDFTKLQLNRIVKGPDGNDLLYDKHYKVLNPEILQDSAFLNSLLRIEAKQGSDISLPFAVYPDMDPSFQGREALYDAIKTYPALDLQDDNDIILIGTKTLSGTEYAIIEHSDDAFLLEYAPNPDGSVSIGSYAKGSTGESLGNFGYSMNYVTLGRSLYWTTFGDSRWATTEDGKETDTSKTVPTDYTGFRFVWADLHTEDYPADDGFFLAEVDSVRPPGIVIPMVGNTLLSALGFNV